MLQFITEPPRNSLLATAIPDLWNPEMRVKCSFPRSVSSRSSSGGEAGKAVSSTASKVCAGRAAFGLCLVATAVILGFLAHLSISRSEESLATAQYDALADQYDSIADRALIAALGINLRKRLGTISLASVLSHAHPNAEDWPFVTLPGFEDIATNLIKTSSGRESALCPLVTPEQLSSFEDFAYDFFENKRDPPFPNGTGMSSFGKGIWGLDFTLNNSDHRYRETDANRSYSSPNKLFTPILQHSSGAHPALLLNVRFEETRGNTVDRIIECARLRAKTGELVECGAITPFIYLAVQNMLDGPGALFFQPVFPANNLTTVSALKFANHLLCHSKSNVPFVLNYGRSQL